MREWTTCKLFELNKASLLICHGHRHLDAMDPVVSHSQQLSVGEDCQPDDAVDDDEDDEANDDISVELDRDHDDDGADADGNSKTLEHQWDQDECLDLVEGSNQQADVSQDPQATVATQDTHERLIDGEEVSSARLETEELLELVQLHQHRGDQHDAEEDVGEESDETKDLAASLETKTTELVEEWHLS